ncbi:cupin domain-containing protein [Caulobacter sp. CCNWLY153]|uniref:cupin domain-containing protein n=1 Tax=unclassified Caulobacter TaxID=2648921 RepID=UPI002FF28A37
MSARRLTIGFLGLAGVAAAGPLHAQDLRLTPPEIAALAKGGAGAGTSGVAGIRTTTLYGDPTKAGPYTIEIRVPPHTRIAAHSHKDDRTAVVVSGTWLFGYGRRNEVPLVKELPPGSFYTEPAGVDHFAQTHDQPASTSSATAPRAPTMSSPRTRPSPDPPELNEKGARPSRTAPPFDL